MFLKQWKGQHVVMIERPIHVVWKAVALQRWWPRVWVHVRNDCTYTGEVNGILDSLFSFKGFPQGVDKWVCGRSQRHRWEGEMAASARDRSLSRSQGFYTWFNILLGKFGWIFSQWSSMPFPLWIKSLTWVNHLRKDVGLKMWSSLFYILGFSLSWKNALAKFII